MSTCLIPATCTDPDEVEYDTVVVLCDGCDARVTAFIAPTQVRSLAVAEGREVAAVTAAFVTVGLVDMCPACAASQLAARIRGASSGGENRLLPVRKVLPEPPCANCGSTFQNASEFGIGS